MSVLYVCSSNPGKVREFTLAAQHSPGGCFQVQPLPGLTEIVPPAEDGASYCDNAAGKARYYSGFADELVFADDSGLEVKALDGAPGIHSARFAGTNANSYKNNALLLDRLRGVTERQARFVTAISLAKQGKLLQTALGEVEGEIIDEPRGTLGFGYDALFLFTPLGRTFAELGDAEKFAVSARGKAFRRLLDWLDATYIADLRSTVPIRY